MSVFDGDGNPINFKAPTMGGKVFWTELDRSFLYVLQRNDIVGHCRILDRNNKRLSWGLEGPMRAKFIELTKYVSRPQLGDVIGVHRNGGLYDHYGIYESDDCIYEFAGTQGDFSFSANGSMKKGNICIHITTLQKFIGKSDNYFILVFPEEYGLPGKLELHRNNAPVRAAIVAAANTFSIAEALRKVPGASTAYHLYSGAETIQRARDRLGETGYWLTTNNCEHYALWCKTGLRTSHQVEELLKSMQALSFLAPPAAAARLLAPPYMFAAAGANIVCRTIKNFRKNNR